MIRISREEKQDVLRRIREGKISAAVLSSSSLIDDIILAMHRNKVIDCLKQGFKDKRADNTTVPFDLVFALAIAAKMKVNTSLTDIPFALTDHRTISELGYSLWGTERDIKEGLMTEGEIRFLVGKYSANELIDAYNHTIQEHIFPKKSMKANIHILDCTVLEVNPKNENYEQSGMFCGKRGYKLSTIRGIIDGSGIIEEILLGPMNVHDLELSRNMLLSSKVFNPGDILINDKGFLSRDIINTMKLSRGVDVYVPIRENMDAHKMAVEIAKATGKWSKHPKRGMQAITLVTDIGVYWRSQTPLHDVPINACVVWDQESNQYFTFVTTDLSKSASQIIMTYELRPEIEEDYRQLKDFWKIEDFKSTKIHIIAFHIVCVLLGYLFFQLFTMMPEGIKLAGKSLPVVLKNYQQTLSAHIVVYAGEVFGVLTIPEMMKIYASCPHHIQRALDSALSQL